jgi:hypothetical protein
MASVIVTKLREKPETQLSIKYIASLVGMAFSRAVMMETGMDGRRNSRL